MISRHSQRVAFVGGRVWTPGYSSPRSLDVLVDGERIVDVARAGELDVESASVHDIAGRLLMPGFQDAHIHPGIGGEDLLGCNLADLNSPDQVFAAIDRYSRDNPDLDWIIGGGWLRDVFPPEGPTRQQLDPLVEGRPAFLSPYDRHGAWVSSAVLEHAGVDERTPDPLGGWFTRDTAGLPTGMVEENALAILRAAIPPSTLQDRQRALLRAQDYLLSLGITSIQDALVGTGLGMLDQHDAYCALLADGRLRLRLTTALWWDPSRGTDQIADLQRRRALLEASAGPDRVIADTVKVMVDGANVLFLDARQVRDATVALDEAGFTAHYHSYGEASTGWILDAVAQARRLNRPGPRRFHIAHLMVVAGDDFARFPGLDVTANVQGFWGDSDVPHHLLGLTTCSDDPQCREYPFGRLHAAGARLAAGSDWPVSTPDPFEAARVAAGRPRRDEANGSQAGAAGVDELDRLDPVALFTAFTAGSAHVNGRAASTGRIAKGFLADLVVVDCDPFAGGTALEGAAVGQTWISGQLEYERAAG